MKKIWIYKSALPYIEFAIHLAAPVLAKLLAGEAVSSSIQKELATTPNDNLYFDLPQTLTPKEAASFLRVSTSNIYEMCRRWQGKFFPHVKVGSLWRSGRPLAL